MRLLRRVLLSLARQFDRLGRGVSYAALGTLALDELRRGIARRWGGFFADERDITSGFMPWEADVVSRFVRAGDRVLVVGSGSGRDLIAFVEMGCHTTGVEPADAAIAAARRILDERRLTVPVVHGFFEEIQLQGSFEFIVFSWLCYCYMPQSRRRVDALRKAAALLAPGGRILVSICTAAEAPSSRLIRIQHLIGRLRGSDWRLEPGDVVAPYRWSTDELSFEHVFAPREFEAEAAAAGLSIVYRNRDEWAFVLGDCGVTRGDGA
jgi:SAM-dependent methyltransferase